MTLTYAEFCAGYGGLGLAVEEVFGAELAWYSEFDAAPSKIMEHHWPGIPNHGDMTTIDFAAVGQVDILSGGTPCQDLSHAGRRAGMKEGTRSNLWVSMREAVATINPTYVIWENVRGAYSAEATSSLEQCPGCMGNPADRGTVLRALGRVLGDLSDLGYDTQWRGLRAADVGAPHGRFRVFVLAAKRGTTADTLRGGSGGRATLSGDGISAGADAPTHGATNRPGESGAARTTATADADLQRREEREQPAVTAESEHPAPSGDNRVLPGAATTDADRNEPERRGGVGVLECAPGAGQIDREERERVREASGDSRAGDNSWGIYAPAVRRWEAVRGAAPTPTELTAKGKHRLNARFAEWMMGVPAGWITDVPGVSRNEQLKAAGNGVVPQQAAEALRDMLSVQFSETLQAPQR